MRNLILNIPHSSPYIPEDSGWSEEIEPYVKRWTDWYTDLLFLPTCNKIHPIVFPYSRFYCDAERLIDDPLEKIGQGICYSEFEGVTRNLTQSEKENALLLYSKHQNSLKSVLDEDSILIDCHSFPSFLSEIDVCIGYNEDWSKPSQQIIEGVVSIFEAGGLKVGINEPYSNSISPIMQFNYPSFMIELNKRVYLDDNLTLKSKIEDLEIRKNIAKIYDFLLDI